MAMEGPWSPSPDRHGGLQHPERGRQCCGTPLRRDPDPASSGWPVISGLTGSRDPEDGLLTSTLSLSQPSPLVITLREMSRGRSVPSCLLWAMEGDVSGVL